MTWKDNISGKEKHCIEELRRRTLSDVTPKMLEDGLLFYRFCKARDFDLSQAESMLRKHIAWRKEFQMDTILREYYPPEVLTKYAPSSFLCFTKDGALIRYVDGGADLKGLLQSASKTDFMKFFMFHVEEDGKRVVDHYKRPGHPLLMYMPIFDLQDFSYANATSMKGIQYLLFVTKSYMDNYPEKLKLAMFINAPSYCTWTFNLLKQILPSTVKQKIRFFGTDGWKQDLLEQVDADDLPAFLGGTKTDPDGDPLCKTFVKRGEPVPERYYLRHERVQPASDSDSQSSLTVLPLSKEEIALEVKEAQACLEWEFQVRAKDIDYSVHFREGTQHVELIPNQRASGPEKGTFKCEKAGTYAIVFDNTYSWVHSKVVHYRVKIKSKEEVETSSKPNIC